MRWIGKRGLTASVSGRIEARVGSVGNLHKTHTPHDATRTIALESSTKNRLFYVAYLAVSFYVLVMALGITDKELLLNQRQLPIPLLSLGLPPSIWFLVAPGALAILYLDLILNLHEHLRKLVAWRESNGGELPPNVVQPFIVDFAFAHRRKGFFGWLYYSLLWLSVAMLAPVALMVCFLKFGRYQSELTSAYHLLLVWGSLFLASYFMQSWRLGTQEDQAKSKVGTGFQNGLGDFASLGSFFKVFKNWVVGFLVVFSGLYGILIFNYAQGQRPAVWEFFHRLAELNFGIGSGVFRYFNVLEPSLSVRNAVLVSVSTDEKLALEILQARQEDVEFAELRPALREVESPNNVVMKNSKNVAELWWKHGAKLDLSRRNLNFINLSGSLLPRVRLEGAQLMNASLYETQLQGADFQRARLNGARLGFAQLTDASFTGAELIKADFSNANLQGASFSGARSFNADFSDAELQGSNFRHAALYAAVFEGARLQGVDFEFAQLHNAYLKGAQLHGSSFRGAFLYGASCAGRYDILNELEEDSDCQGDRYASAICQMKYGPMRAQPSRISGCDEKNWLIRDKEHLDKLTLNLRGVLSGNDRHHVLDQMKASLKKKIWESANCGELNYEMVNLIQNSLENHEHVPDEALYRWQNAAQPCIAPIGNER